MKKLWKSKKYIIIAIVGVIIMLMSKALTNRTEQTEKVTTQNSAHTEIEQLENVLENIQGAGEIQLFVSYEDNGCKEIAQQIERGEDSVLNIPESIGDTYYVLSEQKPEIAGVLVTATGAGNKNVRNRLLTAVKHALGIPYYKISIQIGSGGRKE